MPKRIRLCTILDLEPLSVCSGPALSEENNEKNYKRRLGEWWSNADVERKQNIVSNRRSVWTHIGKSWSVTPMPSALLSSNTKMVLAWKRDRAEILRQNFWEKRNRTRVPLTARTLVWTQTEPWSSDVSVKTGIDRLHALCGLPKDTATISMDYSWL